MITTDCNRLHKQIVWVPCDLTQAYNLKEKVGGKWTQAWKCGADAFNFGSKAYTPPSGHKKLEMKWKRFLNVRSAWMWNDNWDGLIKTL